MSHSDYLEIIKSNKNPQQKTSEIKNIKKINISEITEPLKKWNDDYAKKWINWFGYILIDKVNIYLNNYYNKNILFDNDSVDPLKDITKFFTNDNDKNNDKKFTI